MYSRHTEGKSIIAERFIRALKDRIYKYATLVSKSGYIDKLDDIVNKYNNTYHSTIKIKHSDVKSNTYIDSSKKINDKIANLKLVIMLEYQNTKLFLQNITLEVGLKKFLWLKKLKILYGGHMLLMVLTEKKLLERFMKKISKKQIKNSLELEK